MNVRLGWSGDIHGTWTKMDVEVDENDLNLFFANKGVEDFAVLEYSPVEKFKLMYSLAEVFVQLHKMSRFPQYFGKPQDEDELRELIKAQDKLTKEILERSTVV
jgi:hypothetical protein